MLQGAFYLCQIIAFLAYCFDLNLRGLHHPITTIYVLKLGVGLPIPKSPESTNRAMSFKAILGQNALRQAMRRREDSTSRDQRTVHEAARLVFCVYHGIPVEEIRMMDGVPIVRYQTEYAFRDSNCLRNCIQMIMSGVITVQTVLVQENMLFDVAMREAHQLFELCSSNSNEAPQDFDDIILKSSKRTIAQMADPKLRSAISSISRILLRERDDFTPESLERLLQHTRGKLSG